MLIRCKKKAVLSRKTAEIKGLRRYTIPFIARARTIKKPDIKGF